MLITELILKNFGKFSDTTVSFSEGMNLIYGENESGKSTVYTFLKGMFFGMERGRGRAAVNDTFSQYEPWENPNYYAGAVRFVCGSRKFRLERNFDKYSKRVSLFCEDDGEELSVEQGDLEMLLEGMSEAEYESTVAVGQMKPLEGMTLAASLKNYAANYYAAGNGEIDLEGALGKLKERKKELDKETRALERRKQEKRERIEQEASYVWRDIRRLEKDIEQISEEWEENCRVWEESKEERRQRQKIEAQEGRFARWRIHPVEAFSMVAAIVLSSLLLSRPWNFLVMVVVALAEGLYTWNRLKDGRRKEADVDAEEKRRMLELSEMIEKQKWEMDKRQEDCKEKQVQYSNLKEQLEELDEVGEDAKEQEKQRAAIELSMQLMLELSSEMQNQMGKRMNERVSEILSEVTLGKYEKVWVDEKLHVNLFSDGKRVPMEQVSRGTIEQIYFAIRMAASEILYDEEYPVILDDAFVYYDDARTEAVLRWLGENRKQVIIFTCQKRESEILKKRIGNKIVTKEMRL